MISGSATSEGTARYAARFPEAAQSGFYRDAGAYRVSSLGVGTFLGGLDDETDRAYEDALIKALISGINFVDTSLNYRLQRSELAVGAALRKVIESHTLGRDEVVVCTKAGYLVPGATPMGLFKPGDLVGGIHSMAPSFLEDQLDRSRANLGLETIDIFYLHNPESQLGQVSAKALNRRFRSAFETLEAMVERGKIRAFGAATWQAFRADPESGRGITLGRLLALADEVAGKNHHFRFIQLPMNMVMTEAYAARYEELDGEPASVLELARAAGISVIASASLLQARLANGLPESFTGRIEASSDAQRAIQFARSAPGVDVALVGMSRAEHVRQNLGVSRIKPLSPECFAALF